jgi:YidC/Oxa1 family membrane protein insertase
MIAAAWWQSILNGLGWVLARLYDFIPNYGVAIIILTVAIRLLLLPLGVKQIRSMQATAALQPKMKALQQKYKGDRTKLNEEMMKLYKEYGYNPLSGCFPLLLQLPVLIALFAVLRFPTGLTHVPTESRLYSDIVAQHTSFAGANLLCSATDPEHQVATVTVAGHKQTIQKDCGKGIPAHIPYYVMALLMVGTTFFQQRQMQKASPAGANPQQQTLMRIMPLLFGFWGFIFPAGLVVYWTTTNIIQIGQQRFLFRHQPTPPVPVSKDGRGDRSGRPGGRRPRPDDTTIVRKRPAGSSKGGTSRGGGAGTGRPKPGANGRSGTKRSPDGGQASGRGGRQTSGSAGGRDAGDRKKRPKR